MGTPRSFGRAFAALGSLSLFGFAACQQVLGLDQPTVSVSAISRICECIPLTQQGLAFAGNDDAACELALATEADELLLAVAENDCTDCANVSACYAQLTRAREEGDTCGDSSECASWSCCQGVFTVEIVVGEGPQLASTPTEARCCQSCSPCLEALDVLNSDTELVACAESEAPLNALLSCFAANANGACQCLQSGGITPECLDCLETNAAQENVCVSEYAACQADQARPIPVPE